MYGYINEVMSLGKDNCGILYLRWRNFLVFINSYGEVDIDKGYHIRYIAWMLFVFFFLNMLMIMFLGSINFFFILGEYDFSILGDFFLFCI